MDLAYLNFDFPGLRLLCLRQLERQHAVLQLGFMMKVLNQREGVGRPSSWMNYVKMNPRSSYSDGTATLKVDLDWQRQLALLAAAKVKHFGV